MASTAQYVTTAKIGVGRVTTADTSRTAPTTIAYLFAAGASGSRIDRVNMCGVGTTVASMLRLFLIPGFAGGTISTITFSSTTATVTTAAPHGLTTGFKATIQGAYPFDYNMSNVSITVTGASSFTYTMSTTPTINASTVGAFIYTVAAPTYRLLKEIAVTAITPSASVAAYISNLSLTIDTYFMPIMLPAGWALVASVNDTQTSSGVDITAYGGDF